MEDSKLKRHTKEQREEMLKEFEKPIDFKNAIPKESTKTGIYINLDNDVLNYFKLIAAQNGYRYQNLINEALRYFKEKKLKPKTEWK